MEFIKKYAGLVVGVVVALIYGLSFILYPLEKDQLAFNLVDVHLSLSKYLVYGLIALTLFFFCIKVSKDPKSGIRFGIGLLLLIILFFISYSSASSDTSELTGIYAESKEYKIVGGMITTTVVLIFTGLAALVGFGIKNLIENAKA